MTPRKKRPLFPAIYSSGAFAHVGRHSQAEVTPYNMLYPKEDEDELGVGAIDFDELGATDCDELGAMNFGVPDALDFDELDALDLAEIATGVAVAAAPTPPVTGRKLGAKDNTAPTLICVELLGGSPALTRTGRNRAAANPSENFMITEKERFLHSQDEMWRDGLLTNLLIWVK
ncbi:hypothetical protein F5888DRAFT_1634559 [Russula emetica]|nr:hypothetical protein F5888DRAFT_1634559 [Russula emetica]